MLPSVGSNEVSMSTNGPMKAIMTRSGTSSSSVSASTFRNQRAPKKNTLGSKENLPTSTEDEIQVLEHITPSVTMQRLINDLFSILESNQDTLLREMTLLRSYILDMFSSCIVELNEHGPHASNEPSESRLERFLGRLGESCTCLRRLLPGAQLS